LNTKTKGQFISYSIVGLISTILDFIIYYLLSSYTSLSMSSAKRISFIIGTTNSFIFNKKFSFKSNNGVAYELIRYFVVWTISFILNSLVHDYSSKIISGYVPFIVATFISICINFLGAKYWVFKK